MSLYYRFQLFGERIRELVDELEPFLAPKVTGRKAYLMQVPAANLNYVCPTPRAS